MLSFFTGLVDFCAMAITLWLGLYLLGRGFPSQIALRAVAVLLALSLFFASAFLNLFQQVEGATAVRAVLLVIGMATWYSLTYHFLPVQHQKRLRWVKIAVYLLSGFTAVILILMNPFIDEKRNLLWVGRMEFGLPYILYSIFQLVVYSGILYNLLTEDQIGLKPQGRYLLLASLFPLPAVGYGVLALAITPPLPRLVQDLLIFSGVFLLGISVARYQMLVERRTTLQDLPILGLILLGLSALHAWLAWRWGFTPVMVAAITVLAILTLSIYDLGHEFLERQRLHNESAFRRQLRRLESEVSNQDSLRYCLQAGLDLLCRTIRASKGFIAVRQGDTYIVSASFRAIQPGCELRASLLTCEDVTHPDSDQLPEILWLAPVFEADQQVAVIAIGYPKNRLQYTAGDLDLLGEVTERVGTIVALSNAQPAKAEKLRQFVAEVHNSASDLRVRTDEMLATMAKNPDPELIKLVEEGLRHLHDYITLGQLELADWVGVGGASHIERGRKLQGILSEAIETLRPSGPRPAEPLPRVWYNYAVLYDAYVECVTNREIMARLYISEGTFNRTRRNALRGLARLFLEKEKLISPA